MVTVMEVFHKAWCNGRLSVVVAWMLLTASGCGAKVPHADRGWVNVQVAVTAAGQPIGAGEVALLAKQGSTGVDAGGFVDAKGLVSIPALPGSYVAVIRPLTPPPEVPASGGSVPDISTGEQVIPKRFRSPATSPLTVEIRSGEKNQFTFDLVP